MLVRKNLSNIPGWKTDRKFIVFESDDWGSIRIPDLKTRDLFISKGIKVDQNFFTCYDALEDEKDLENLFEVLTSVRDSNGNPAVFSTLNILGNPDFKKIEEHNFSEYFWEGLGDTYEAYGFDSGLMQKLWKRGMEKQIIAPGFHGKEHLHVNRWMRGLQEKLPVTMLAFNHKFTGIHPFIAGEKRKEYQAAFDVDSMQDIELLKQTIPDGLDAFERYFGFRTRYFVPANGFLPKQLLSTLKEHGIKFINTPKSGKQPTGEGDYRHYLRYSGMRTKEGLIYITRNASFEPSNFAKQVNWVNKCLEEISIAFKWNKAAVIGTHRVNFIGRIDVNNRIKGLELLQELLHRIVKKWPDAEFISTEAMGSLIEQSQNRP